MPVVAVAIAQLAPAAERSQIRVAGLRLVAAAVEATGLMAGGLGHWLIILLLGSLAMIVALAACILTGAALLLA